MVMRFSGGDGDSDDGDQPSLAMLVSPRKIDGCAAMAVANDASSASSTAVHASYQVHAFNRNRNVFFVFIIITHLFCVCRALYSPTEIILLWACVNVPAMDTAMVCGCVHR